MTVVFGIQKKRVLNYFLPLPAPSRLLFKDFYVSRVTNNQLLESSFQHLEAGQIVIKEQQPPEHGCVFFSSR